MSKAKEKQEYGVLVHGIEQLLEEARRSTARAVNAVMSALYWEIGRRIVAFEQHGHDRATYGNAVVDRVAEDLSARLGRGFSRRNVFLMRAFFLAYSNPFKEHVAHQLFSAPIVQTMSAQLSLQELAQIFPLPWSHYVRLLSVGNEEARAFYETEALRNGWSVRQLDRQIATLFYERTALSKKKASMLKKGE